VSAPVENSPSSAGWKRIPFERWVEASGGSLDPGSVLVIAFLLGVRVDDARRLAQVGRRARVYVPYGVRETMVPLL